VENGGAYEPGTTLARVATGRGATPATRGHGQLSLAAPWSGDPSAHCLAQRRGLVQ